MDTGGTAQVKGATDDDGTASLKGTGKKGKKGSKKLTSKSSSNRVALPSWSPILPVASSSREAILKASLLASATGRSFEDVNFFVFSRRRLDGLVDHPLPLRANSSLIRKASPHFDYLFAQGFAESGIMDMAAPYPSTRADSTDEYAYGSDSDLEDEEDTETPRKKSDDEDIVDSTRGDSTDPGGSATEEEFKPAVVPKKPANALPGHPGRVVFLDDIAYKTWRAFIFYAYLGEKELSFAPLRSEQKSTPNELKPDQAPPCSPKSMYRLADKYDIAPLKELAAAEIMKRLSTHNILEEIFSTFTSMYPDIRTKELDFLRRNMHVPDIQSRLPSWIEALEDGRLPKGAGRILTLLLSCARFN
ncbi:hypothetical protein VTO73DRAFT_6138 [Trametes versicolor]